MQQQDVFLAGDVGSIPVDTLQTFPDLLEDGVALPEQLRLVSGSPKQTGPRQVSHGQAARNEHSSKKGHSTHPND